MFGNIQILGWFAAIPSGGGSVTGLGTVNMVAKFTAPTVIGNSIIFDDGTSVGIGTITPVGIETVFGMVAGINQRWEPVANVIEDLSGARITTTDATVTTLQTIPVASGKGLLIEARITAKKNSGAGIGTVGDVNAYVRTVKAKNVAGVVTIGTIQTSFTHKGQAHLSLA